MYGNEYCRPEVPADAAPGEKEKSGGGCCGGGLLCPDGRRKGPDGPGHRHSGGKQPEKEIVAVLEAYEADKRRRTACLDIDQTDEFEIMELGSWTEHTRAVLKVQDGCNQFCSYCIIPYARGRIRSLPVKKAVEQVQALVSQGFQEIVLTGIHISSYGKDLKERENQEGKKEDLLSLIQAVHQVEGLKRLRLGSLEPGIITEGFAKELSRLEKFCPHFHLSLQSGSREVLRG